MKRSLYLVLGLTGLLALPAGATSYVMMSDEALLSAAPLVAQVSVLTITPAPAAGTPSTDHIVLVEKVLKGNAPGSTLVVRVPGGESPNGYALRIHGAPQFNQGERAILFLMPRKDGTYGVFNLMLGAFHQLRSGAHTLAVRNLDGAFEVPVQGRSVARGVRDFEKFSDWLTASAAGKLGRVDYFVAGETSGMTSAPRYELIKFKKKPIRFFEFDTGQRVEWKVGKGLSGAKKQFKKALKLFNKAPLNGASTPSDGSAASAEGGDFINLKFKGKTSATTGLTGFDDINALIFNDPNDESPGSFDCNEGGVIAFASAWWFTGPVLLRDIPSAVGKGQAHVAQGADIVTNDNTKCVLSPKTAKAEVFSHELGHTLGLDHTCGDDDSGPCKGAENDALMGAFFHGDGFGADLGSDDLKWLDKLY